LSTADHAHLTSLLYHRTPGLLPHPEPHRRLSELLKSSATSSDPADLENRVGLADQVTLVSPADARDFYEPRIVLPAEANLDTDRISVLTPLGFAVLGRKIGDIVSWEMPAGTREMKIAAVHKHELTPS